jgi:uncharacterized membrane protein YfcA
MMHSSPWLVVLVGVAVGVFVGLLGTSGAIMIPVMIYVFGLTQLRAQGTSLFIALLPIWIFPLVPYARSGNVEWKLGLLLAAGVAVGGYLGGHWAQGLPVGVLRKGFAVLLAAVAVRLFLQR